eukprot:1858373-Amphidinium_carterae.1
MLPSLVLSVFLKGFAASVATDQTVLEHCYKSEWFAEVYRDFQRACFVHSKSPKAQCPLISSL